MNSAKIEEKLEIFSFCGWREFFSGKGETWEKFSHEVWKMFLIRGNLKQGDCIIGFGDGRHPPKLMMHSPVSDYFPYFHNISESGKMSLLSPKDVCFIQKNFWRDLFYSVDFSRWLNFEFPSMFPKRYISPCTCRGVHPSESMMHPLCFRLFPPISEKFSDAVGNLSCLTFSQQIFSISIRQNFWRLFLVVDWKFWISPCLRKLVHFPFIQEIIIFLFLFQISPYRTVQFCYKINM